MKTGKSGTLKGGFYQTSFFLKRIKKEKKADNFYF
jgi:hypothetical protein